MAREARVLGVPRTGLAQLSRSRYAGADGGQHILLFSRVFTCFVIFARLPFKQVRRVIRGFDSRQLRHEQQCGQSPSHSYTDARADLTRPLVYSNAFAAAFEEPLAARRRRSQSKSPLGQCFW